MCWPPWRLLGVGPEQFTDWTVAVDKLDKIGEEGVVREFEQRGLPASASAQLPSLVALRNHLDPLEALDAMSAMLQDHEAGQEALVSLRELVERAMATGVSKDCLRIDALLARGLDYYTGAIFEVTVDDAPVGSICGGGRYDDLTGIFGWSGMSGVGVSFGADRIEDVLNHFDAWPAMVSDSLDVMVVQMDGGDLAQELSATASLRDCRIVVELYPDRAKLKKQFKYANDRNVRWVMVLGEDERNAGKVMLKDMHEGAQDVLTMDEAVRRVQASRLS